MKLKKKLFFKTILKCFSWAGILCFKNTVLQFLGCIIKWKLVFQERKSMLLHSRNENEKSKLWIPPPQNPKFMTIREKGIHCFKLSAHWTHSILQGCSKSNLSCSEVYVLSFPEGKGKVSNIICFLILNRAQTALSQNESGDLLYDTKWREARFLIWFSWLMNDINIFTPTSFWLA